MFRSIAALIFVCGSFFQAGVSEGKEAIRVEFSRGFKTTGSAEHLPAIWASLKEHQRMKGEIANYLVREKIESVIMLEVNIAIALDPRFPGLLDELFVFMGNGKQFAAGELPDGLSKRPQKQLVAVIRMKSGEYGLITVYRDMAVVELQGRIGVVPRDEPRR